MILGYGTLGDGGFGSFDDPVEIVGGGGGGATVTWNPADKDGNVDLSDGDMVATTTEDDFNSVRATEAITTGGLVYFEAQFTAAGTVGANNGIGIANASFPLNVWLGTPASGSIGIYPTDAVVYGVTSGTLANAPAVGDWIGVAVDFDNKLIWFRVQGEWNAGGSADPSTGVGGFSYSHTGDMFAACTTRDGGEIIVNFGFTDFDEDTPSGYETLDAPPEPESPPAGVYTDGDGIFGSLIFGYDPMGSSGESSGIVDPPDEFPRIVAIVNGPSGFIKQVDANGLTHVDIRFNGFITYGFDLSGGPGDVLRFYRDPPSVTGAVFNELLDPTWTMDLHRGNGFIDLGVFDIMGPVIGETIITGTLALSQAGQTLVGTAKAIVKGQRSGAQAADFLTAQGHVGTAAGRTGTLILTQADNFILPGTAKVIVRGTLSATQASNFVSSSGTAPIPAGLLLADASCGAYVTATPDIDGFLLAEASVGPLIEGAAL